MKVLSEGFVKRFILNANETKSYPPSLVETLGLSHEALRALAADMAQALEFVSMPITTPKDQLTVDNLLETIAENNTRATKALSKYRAAIGEGEKRD